MVLQRRNLGVNLRSRAYLKKHLRYQLENSQVDRSHGGGVQKNDNSTLNNFCVIEGYLGFIFTHTFHRISPRDIVRGD